ncbi:MAG: hypothetical protein M3150_06925 [Pseudomonadota bacterium]|nr:hypothetical protein [Pseudomonadota bacterium]
MFVTFAFQVGPRLDIPPNMAGTKVMLCVSGLPGAHNPATTCAAVRIRYGQTALIDAAMQQMRTLPLYNSFFQTTTPAATALAERLAGRTRTFLRTCAMRWSSS